MALHLQFTSLMVPPGATGTRSDSSPRPTTSLQYHRPRTRPLGPLPPTPHPRRRPSAPRGSMFDGFLDKMAGLSGAPIPPQDQEPYEEEEVEDTFVQLNENSTGSVDGSSEATFGPLAILAVGFLAAEFAALRDLLDEIGAEEVGLIHATEGLLSSASLGDALSIDPAPEHPGDDLKGSVNSSARKVLFLSGMYASEVVEVVAAVREAAPEVPDCAFAAAVPRSWDRALAELVEDVHADHAAMAARRAAAEAAGGGDGA